MVYKRYKKTQGNCPAFFVYCNRCELHVHTTVDLDNLTGYIA